MTIRAHDVSAKRRFDEMTLRENDAVPRRYTRSQVPFMTPGLVVFHSM